MFIFRGIVCVVPGINDKVIIDLSRTNPNLLVEVFNKDQKFLVQVKELESIDDLAVTIITEGNFVKDEPDESGLTEEESAKGFKKILFQ